MKKMRGKWQFDSIATIPATARTIEHVTCLSRTASTLRLARRIGSGVVPYPS
jgi:hypothetical protein